MNYNNYWLSVFSISDNKFLTNEPVNSIGENQIYYTFNIELNKILRWSCHKHYVECVLDSTYYCPITQRSKNAIYFCSSNKNRVIYWMNLVREGGGRECTSKYTQMYLIVKPANC